MHRSKRCSIWHPVGPDLDDSLNASSRICLATITPAHCVGARLYRGRISAKPNDSASSASRTSRRIEVCSWIGSWEKRPHMKRMVAARGGWLARNTSASCDARATPCARPKFLPSPRLAVRGVLLPGLAGFERVGWHTQPPGDWHPGSWVSGSPLQLGMHRRKLRLQMIVLRRERGSVSACENPVDTLSPHVHLVPPPRFPRRPAHSAAVGATQVARLCSRIDGAGWHAVLDQHLEHERRRTVQCTDYERGRAGVDMWAARHRERIQQEVEEFRRTHPAHRGDTM